MRTPHILAVVLFTFGLAVGGCSDLGTPLKPTPLGLVSTSSLDFGTVAVGQSTTRTVVVTNAGTGKLSATPSISWAEFAIESGGGTFTLRPGESRTIAVRFTPSGIGAFTCALDFGSQPEPVMLGGNGALQTPGARGLVLPDTLAFGSVRVGDVKSLSFDVLSLGTAPLIVDVASPCSDFQIMQGGGPGIILPGDKITVVVAYAPTVPGPNPCILSVGPGVAEVGMSGSGFTISFVADVQPILYENCSFCHYEFADNSDHDTYPFIRQFNRVVPYDLDNSVIYNRIANTGRLGTLMPQGGPQLPAASINTIKQWIAEGALDN